MLRPPMAERPRPSNRYLAYALAVVFFANFLNYADRQVVSALEVEIKGAFAMSKAEFGALWSAFTLGYMVFAPLIGFAAGKYRRTLLFAACVFIWSLATIGSGMATGKTTLFLSRFLIGVVPWLSAEQLAALREFLIGLSLLLVLYFRPRGLMLEPLPRLADR